eukprot:6089449-Pleurochrysis_carterae.AAC.5
MRAKWAAYMRRHNMLADFAARLVGAAEEAGTPWLVENPADCGDRGGVTWWPQFASHALLWLLPPMRAALAKAGAE